MGGTEGLPLSLKQGMPMFLDLALPFCTTVLQHSLALLVKRLRRKSPVLPVTEVGLSNTEEAQSETSFI